MSICIDGPRSKFSLWIQRNTSFYSHIKKTSWLCFWWCWLLLPFYDLKSMRVDFLYYIVVVIQSWKKVGSITFLGLKICGWFFTGGQLIQLGINWRVFNMVVFYFHHLSIVQKVWVFHDSFLLSFRAIYLVENELWHILVSLNFIQWSN